MTPCCARAARQESPDSSNTRQIARCACVAVNPLEQAALNQHILRAFDLQRASAGERPERPLYILIISNVRRNPRRVGRKNRYSEAVQRRRHGETMGETAGLLTSRRHRPMADRVG